MNVPSKKSIVLKEKDVKIRKNVFKEEKKWEELSTGPNCL